MKKSIRLLLLALLTPLLFGGVFAFDLTQSDLNYINSVALYSGSVSTSNSQVELYDGLTDSSQQTSYCILFHDFTSQTNHWLVQASTTNYVSNPQDINALYNMSKPYNLYCFTTTLHHFIFVKFLGGSYSFDYHVLKAGDIFNGKLGFDIAGLTTQLTACNSNLSNCQSDLSTANSNLNSCQSDLLSCQNNGSNCDTLVGVCQENLSGCMADKSSLQNYNEALSTQLNECLNNQGTGSNLSGLILNNNSLFWYLDDSLLSLPINNNLFLPLGYQGALDSGNVLYIKAIDEEEPENYYITPEDKVSIIDILSYIFVFFLGIGIIFSLIKLFKKLFTH